MDNEKWTFETEGNRVQSDNSETGFVTHIPTSDTKQTDYQDEYNNKYDNTVRLDAGKESEAIYAQNSEEHRKNSDAQQDTTGGTGSDTGRTYAGSYTTYSCTTDVQRSAYDRPTGGNESEIDKAAKKKKEKNPKKKNSLFRKCAGFVLAAVVFGSVAGSVIVGVNYAAQKARPAAPVP